jgi:hypothetical protein
MKRIGIFGKKSGDHDDDENGRSSEEKDGVESNTTGGGGGDTMMDVFKKHQRNRARTSSQEGANETAGSATAARPSYRIEGASNDRHGGQATAGDEDGGGGGGDEDDHYDQGGHAAVAHNKMEHIEKSAGTSRLNRILRTTAHTTSATASSSANTSTPTNLDGTPDYRRKNANHEAPLYHNLLFGGGAAIERTIHEKVAHVKNLAEIALFCSRLVIPPLKVDAHSIGGVMLDGYPESMQQECLYTALCESFESTGTESVVLSALQYPHDYGAHKRALGLLGGGGGGTATAGKHRATKVRYVLLVRSTNRPVLAAAQQRQLEMLRLKQMAQHKQQQLVQEKEQQQQQRSASADTDESERGDYDAMFAVDKDDFEDDDDDDGEGGMRDVSMNSPSRKRRDLDKTSMTTTTGAKDEVDEIGNLNALDLLEEEEISSFPALVCLTLNSDGTGPDIRKLIPLDQLTTVQDLHSNVVQLAFNNGDTIRLEFENFNDDRNKVVERPLDKERFIWSLLQIHAMLCMAVVERHSRGATFLPPLNVRNLDRAELQYVATINGFLKKDETLRILLERQRKSVEESEAMNGGVGGVITIGEGKLDMTDMDTMAYNLMMGNFATRVTLFHSEDERKDAEEILNSPEWTDMLNSKEDTAAVSVAERLGFMLQSRMRDLEAETCRRLIAWEDEKHSSLGGRAKLHDVSDARDTVDALALASLFKTLESLDAELKAMEDWLQDRAAAIKPLTDDCADIEEENRQLEQQWKSYDMLGAEMRRLLHGQEIDETTKIILRNPASVLVYDAEGLVDVEESEVGIERIYEAGKALLDALEFVSETLRV